MRPLPQAAFSKAEAVLAGITETGQAELPPKPFDVPIEGEDDNSPETVSEIQVSMMPVLPEDIPAMDPGEVAMMPPDALPLDDLPEPEAPAADLPDAAQVPEPFPAPGDHGEFPELSGDLPPAAQDPGPPQDDTDEEPSGFFAGLLGIF